MKKLSLLLIAVLAMVVPVSASFSESRLESQKKSAAAKGKLVAFFFEQDYYDPSCPKCILDVNSNNNAMKKAVPRKYVNLITIDAGESRGVDKIPECVQKAMKKAPQLIVTDAACESVLATIEGRPDRDKAKEFEKKVAEAAGKK
jgi:hypothetical protein